MIKNKKQIAAIVAVNQHFNTTKEVNKISWSDSRSVGWHNQPRCNWTKK